MTEKTEIQNDINKHREIFEAAALFYEKNLEGKQGEKARQYLTEVRMRHISIIKGQRLGCVTKRKLHKHLTDAGFTEAEMIASGMVRKKQETGRLYDYFWKENNVIYPVLQRGKVVDFHTKDYFTKNKGERANYQLSEEYKLDNPLFYGEMRPGYKVLLVEGQEDVNSVFQHYVQQDMCVLGTFGNLGDEQVAYLAGRLKKEHTVYAAFDNDKSGMGYTWKLMQGLLGVCSVRKIIIPQKVKDIDDHLKSLKISTDKLTDLEFALREQETFPADSVKEWHSREDEEKRLRREISAPVQELIDNSQDAVTWWIDNQFQIDENEKEELVLEPMLKLIAQETGLITRGKYVTALCDAAGYKGQQRADLQKMAKQYAKMPADPDEHKEAGVYEKFGCYYYFENDKESKISNFLLKLERKLIIDDEVYYMVQLIHCSGVQSHCPLVLSPEDQTNYRRFRQKVKGHRPGNFHYIGTDKQLSELIMKEEIEAGTVPTIYKIKKFGWVKEHNLWLFDNCLIQNNKIYPADKDGISEVAGEGFQSVDVNVYGGDRPFLDLGKNADEPFIHQVIDLFWTMMDGYQDAKPFRSYKGFLLIAYVAAMAYRPELTARVRRFPNLFSFGPVETGKSEVVKLMMNCFGFKQEGISWTNTTTVGMTNCLEQLSCLPLWMEEYMNSHGRDRTQDSKIAVMREAFTLSAPTKGSLGQKNVSHSVNTSFVITGQDYLTDKAVQSRTIVLRKEKPSELASEAYFTLDNMRTELSRIFVWLLTNKTAETVADFFTNYEECKAFIKQTAKERNVAVSDRTLFNYSLLAAAFSVFNYDKYWDEFIAWIIDETVHAKTMESEADIIHRFFDSVSIIYHSKAQVQMPDVIDFDGTCRVYLHFNAIYNAWQKESRTAGHQEFISSQILRDYMKHAPEGYWIEEKDMRHMFNSGQQRCICLDVNKLPEDLKQTVLIWKTHMSNTVPDEETSWSDNE